MQILLVLQILIKMARGTAISLTDGDSENHAITVSNAHVYGTVTLVQNDVIIIDKKPSDTIAD